MANNPQTDPNTDPQQAQPGLPEQGGDQERIERDDENVEGDDGETEDTPRQ